MIVLGIDPGLAKCGWAVVDIQPHTKLLRGCGVIVTEKGRGQGVLVTEDLHRRGQELARELTDILDTYQPTVVCAESISYPRNAATSAQIGRAWGVIDALLEQRKLPCLSASPQAIKKAVTRKKSASKDDVIDALDTLTDGALRRHLAPIRATTLHEHPADALGAVVACIEHPHLRLALGAAAPRQQELGGLA